MVSTNAGNLIQEIEKQLREEEWITSEWSPIHLKALLEKWYFNGGSADVSALKDYQDTCHYLYFPRLVNDGVFKNAIGKGLETKDFFGFAAGKDGDQYLGFRFGDLGVPIGDEASVLIEKSAAAEYRENTQPAPVVPPIETDPDPGPDRPVKPQDDHPLDPAAVKNQFYATVDVDPVTAKLKFAEMVDEIVAQFTTKLGVDVTISIEIQAKNADGFDEALQRSVKENCNVLNFNTAEFDSESQILIYRS